MFFNKIVREGMNGLCKRLKDYDALGADFAKWRAVLASDAYMLPTRSAIKQNAQALVCFCFVSRMTNCADC